MDFRTFSLLSFFYPFPTFFHFYLFILSSRASLISLTVRAPGVPFILWGGQLPDFISSEVFVVFVFEKQDNLYVVRDIIHHFCSAGREFPKGFFPFFFIKRRRTAFYDICSKTSFEKAQAINDICRLPQPSPVMNTSLIPSSATFSSSSGFVKALR